MPLKIGDRVRENTSSTGVGGLSLTGAPAGFQRFNEILSSGDTTYYALEENDQFEVGIGTYGSNNLERTTVLSSSNSGNKISLGGSGVVFITYPASKAIFNSETNQLVLGPSGLKFHDGNSLVGPKLVELIDVSLSGTPVHSSVFNLNLTAKSLTIGDRVGNSNTANVLLGYGAGSGITTGSSNIIIGAEAATKTTTGFRNVHIGQLSGPNLDGSDVSAHQSVSIGYRAGDKMRHDAIAIGNLAAVNTYKEGFIAIGSSAGSGIGVYGVGVGYKALEDYGDGYSVGVGYEAGKSGGGQDGVWLGNSAGKNSSGATRSIGIGKNAGKSSTATDSIYIGHNAGDSNSSNDHIYIGNGTPASNGTLIKGNMSTGRIAVGSADVTLSDTFYVGVSSSSENGIVVKGAVSQSADLTQWKNSSDVVLASVSNSGVVTGNAISASGNGLKLASVTPVSTSNTLYNVNSTLHWNGLAIGTPSGVPSGVAFFGDDSSIAQDQNIKYDSTNQRLQLGDGGIRFKDGTTQTTADNDTYVSGVAAYASGAINGGNIAVGEFIYHHGETNTYLQFNPDKITAFAGGKEMLKIIEQAQDQVIINDDGETINLVAKGNNDSNLLKTDPTNDRVAIGAASPEYKLDVAGHDALIRSSGLIVGNSGIVLANNAPAVTTNTLYNEGGTLKFNGSAIGGGDVTTAQLNYVSGVAVYSSGQTISNQGNITALLSASGTATSLIASSGIATYASGQAISNQSNITALLSASGTATSLISSSGIATYASGQAIANESDIVAVSGIAAYASGVGGGGGDVTTAQLNYVSGIAVYSSGLAITNEAEVTYASGLAITNEGRVNYASGQAISNQSNITALNTASGIATSLLAVSGTATSLVATSGIATYASGQAIANESDIVAVSGIANYASGQVNVTTDGTAEASKALVLDSAKSFTGVKDGRFSEFDSFVYSTGVSVGNSGVLIARNTPGVTTDTLYNIGGTLYFNGSQLASAGGASAEAQYASGQAISNQGNITALLSASGTATSLIASSGIATYASGQAISNQSNITALNAASGIATSLLAVSGTATSLVASSGIAAYASGQAISNQGNITALLSASGTATSLIASSGIASYASGQAISNQGNITALLSASGTATSLIASSGQATYASGQAISNQGNITALLSASGTATSLIASSGIATYASGQAIANESDIVATSGIANYASGQAISNQGNITALLTASGTATSLIASSGIATYASGQAIENEGDLVAVSGIAAYASGVSLTVKEADNNPNVANVRTIVVSNGTLTDNGAGQVTISTGGGGGGMTNFTLAGDGGSNQTIADGNTLTVAGGNGITTAGAATDTVSIAVDAAQTTITSLLATDIKIGEDNETKIDFETADEIHFYANNVEQVYLADNIFGPQSDSDVDLGSTSVRWKDAFVDSITVTGEIDGNSLDIEGDADINGTTNLDAVDIDGNVQIDGTVTVGVDDTGKDVKFYGATSGSYLEWDESEDRLNLVGAAYVQEAVPANDTPTAEDATVTLDLKKGNFHNISLGQNVTKFEFINAKRGQRFILRITQHASSAKTVAWTDVDYTTGGAAATVRWAGNVVPTMSTSTSHTDVYGFLCTNNAGSNFDGFIIGQDLPD